MMASLSKKGVSAAVLGVPRWDQEEVLDILQGWVDEPADATILKKLLT